MVEKVLNWIDRAKSRIYTVAFMWLAIIFSPVVFTAIFTDQELIYKKTGLLKNEYITERYLNVEHWAGISYILLGICLAVLLTYLTIWKFPKWFVNPSHRKEADNQAERDIYQLIKEQDVEKEKKNLAEEQVETTRALVEVAEQKEELETREEDLWKSDYVSFRKTKYFDMFNEVKECLYEYGGRTYVSGYYDNSPPKFELDSDMAAYLDANELSKNSSGELSLTNKGRYFMKRYLQDKQ